MSDYGYRTRVKVKFNNTDVSEDINSRLKSITFTDKADGETDDIKIVIGDPDNLWIGSWLTKETENREAANKSIASGQTETSSSGGSTSSGETYTVTAKIGLYVRSGPGTNYYAMGGLVYGAETEVLEITDGWAKINFYGYTGYCAAQYLQRNAGEVADTDSTGDGDSTNGAKYTKIEVEIVEEYRDDGEAHSLYCGTFELDDVSVSGPPQVVTMSATSLSYESALRKTRKTQSWNSATLKEIAQKIAERGGYSLQYISDYNPKYTYMLQSNKTDMVFLQERAAAAGLSLKVTDNAIILYDQKDFEALEAVRVIERGDGTYSSYSFDTTLSTTAYSSCHVSFEDEDGNSYEATFTPATAYSEGEVLEVTEEVSSNDEALTLAQKRLHAANKGETSGSFKMRGDTSLQAGMNVGVKGWGDFDGKYTIDEATHSVSGKYTTSINISKVIEGY